MYKIVKTKLDEREIEQLTAIREMAGFRTNYEFFQAILRGFVKLVQTDIKRPEVPMITLPDNVAKEIADIFEEYQNDALLDDMEDGLRIVADPKHGNNIYRR